MIIWEEHFTTCSSKMTTQGIDTYYALPRSLKLFDVSWTSIMTFFETLAIICKKFCKDGGGKFTSKKVEEHLSQQGIRHEINAPYSPEHNGFCERDNRTIMESVHSLLHTSEFLPNFWAEACHTVVYTLNLTGCRLIPGNTPFILWHGFKSSLEHLIIFGCHPYAYIGKQQRTKLDPKSHLCYFLGYCDNTKGYRLWDPVTSKVLLRRDVIFNEQLLYGSLEEKSPSSSSDNLSHASLSLTSPSHPPDNPSSSSFFCFFT